MRLRGRREKVFGPGRAVPLDRNAKARILACLGHERHGRRCTSGARPNGGGRHLLQARTAEEAAEALRLSARGFGLIG